MSTNPSRLLAAVLAADAASCLVLGLAFVAGAAWIAQLTALPQDSSSPSVSCFFPSPH